jgi:hypothetical protein
VTFIPLPGKLDYTKSKAYCPISLLSFLLKTMKKLVDRHIRDGVLTIHPLHRNQHAYQKGKSTETALRNCYIVGREPGSVCGWEKSAGRCALPLLWNLDLDDLWELNDSGYYMVGYANDIAILINGKFPQTVSGLTNSPVHSPTVV